MYVKLLSNLDIHGAGIERIAGVTTFPNYTQKGKSNFMNGFLVNMTLPNITNEIGQIECNKI